MHRGDDRAQGARRPKNPGRPPVSRDRPGGRLCHLDRVERRSRDRHLQLPQPTRLVPVSRVRGETGLALIIAWKAVKAVILLVAGIGLLVSLGSGLTPLIERIAAVTHVAPDLLQGPLPRLPVTPAPLPPLAPPPLHLLTA